MKKIEQIRNEIIGEIEKRKKMISSIHLKYGDKEMISREMHNFILDDIILFLKKKNYENG